MSQHSPQRARPDHTTDPAERARALAIAMLDRAARSAADLRARLIAKEVEPQIADALIERYREVGLIDDRALAAAIARTRHLERGQAPRAIATELKRKGFGAEHIESALEPLTAEIQHDTATALARRRWQALSGLSPETRTRRVVAFLGRKGYAPSLAFSLVRDLHRAENASERDEGELQWRPPSP